MRCTLLRPVGFVAAALVALPCAALDATLVASGFNVPVFLTAPAGDARLFVVEKGGTIKLLSGGVASTYLDLSGLVDTSGERGLLGLAFDPAFGTNGRLFVNYIDKTSKDTVVAMYTASSASADTADPASGKTILTIDQSADQAIHKAGWIGFRPGEPGNLYIASGDGGPGNDPSNNAQNLASNLGKILRVTPQAGGGYTVPADNPFVGAAGNVEIWAYGLRNPYRNSFDRQSGDFWIADVGEDLREELNFEAADFAGGANYGWRAREGSVDNPNVGDSAPVGAVDPFYEYAQVGGGRAIIGGYVYRGGAVEGLDGTYFFGDFVTGQVFSARKSGASFVDVIDRTAELGNPLGAWQLASFGEDGYGGLYAVARNGNIYQIAAGVPEPSTYALMLAGLALLGWMARRRG
ncbi:MAG: PQQ-dependent sugar dehydrogenase [Burkholderiales bacterium]|nr:PQQ-dependent sugar dehydrogenase [Burkholderiales bacterium]